MLMAWVSQNSISLLLNFDDVEIYHNLVYILLKATINELIDLPCFSMDTKNHQLHVDVHVTTPFEPNHLKECKHAYCVFIL